MSVVKETDRKCADRKQIVAVMLLVTVTALDDDTGYCNTLQHAYHEQDRFQYLDYTLAELLPKVFACIKACFH